SGRETDITDVVVRHLLEASGDRESDLLKDIHKLLPKRYQSNKNGLKVVSRCQIEATLRVLLAETQSIVQCLHEREGGLQGVLEGWLHQQPPDTGTASRVALKAVLGGLEESLPYDRVLANRGYGVCQTLLGQLDSLIGVYQAKLIAGATTGHGLSLPESLGVSRSVILRQDLRSQYGSQYSEDKYVATEGVAGLYSDFMEQATTGDDTPSQPLLVLLADMGMGKTWAATHLTLATAKDPSLCTIPFYHSLRKPVADGALGYFGASNPVQAGTHCAMLHARRGCRTLLVLDGFDEIAVERERVDTINWVCSFLESANGTALAVITCRGSVWYTEQCVDDSKERLVALTYRATAESLSSGHCCPLTDTEVGDALSRYGLPAVPPSPLRDMCQRPFMLRIVSTHLAVTNTLPDPSDPEAFLPVFIDLKDTSTHTILYRMGVSKGVRRHCLLPFLKLLKGDAGCVLSDSDDAVLTLTQHTLWQRLQSSGLIFSEILPFEAKYSISPVYQSTVKHLMVVAGLMPPPPVRPPPPVPVVDKAKPNAFAMLSAALASGSIRAPSPGDQAAVEHTENPPAVDLPAPQEEGEERESEGEGEASVGDADAVGWSLTRSFSMWSPFGTKKHTEPAEEDNPLLLGTPREQACEAVRGWLRVSGQHAGQLGVMLSACLPRVPTAAHTLQEHLAYVQTLSNVVTEGTAALEALSEEAPLHDAIIGCVPPFPMVRHLADIGTYLADKTIRREAGPVLSGLASWKTGSVTFLKEGPCVLVDSIGAYHSTLPAECDEVLGLERVGQYLRLAESTDTTPEELDGRVRLVKLCESLGVSSRVWMTKILMQPRRRVVAEMCMAVRAPNAAGIKTTKNRDVFLLTDLLVVRRDHQYMNSDKSVTHRIPLEDIEVTYEGPVGAPTRVTLQANNVRLDSLFEDDAAAIGLMIQQTQETAKNHSEDPLLRTALAEAIDGEAPDFTALCVQISGLIDSESYLAAYESMNAPLEIYRRLYDRLDTLYGFDLGAVMQYMRALHTGQHPEPPSPLHPTEHSLQLTGPNLRLLSVLEPLGPLRARLKTAMIEDTPLKWVHLAMEGQVEELQSIVSVFKAQMGEAGVYAEGVEEREGEMKSTWLDGAWDTLHTDTYKKALKLMAGLTGVQDRLDMCANISDTLQFIALHVAPVFAPLPLLHVCVSLNHNLLDVVVRQTVEALIVDTTSTDTADVVAMFTFARFYETSLFQLGANWLVPVMPVHAGGPYRRIDPTEVPYPQDELPPGVATRARFSLLDALTPLCNVFQSRFVRLIGTRWIKTYHTKYSRILGHIASLVHTQDVSRVDGVVVVASGHPHTRIPTLFLTAMLTEMTGAVERAGVELMGPLGRAIVESLGGVCDTYSTAVAGLAVDIPSDFLGLPLVPSDAEGTDHMSPSTSVAGMTVPFDRKVTACLTLYCVTHLRQALAVLSNDITTLHDDLEKVADAYTAVTQRHGADMICVTEAQDGLDKVQGRLLEIRKSLVRQLARCMFNTPGVVEFSHHILCPEWCQDGTAQYTVPALIALEKVLMRTECSVYPHSKELLAYAIPTRLISAYISGCLLRLSGRDSDMRLNTRRRDTSVDSHTLQSPHVRDRVQKDLHTIGAFLESQVATMLPTSYRLRFVTRFTAQIQVGLDLIRLAGMDCPGTLLKDICQGFLGGPHSLTEESARLLLSLRGPAGVTGTDITHDTLIDEVRSVLSPAKVARQLDGGSRLSHEEKVFLAVSQYSDMRQRRRALGIF
ncbi:hypothetical protein KIPB_003295, partial [Kipferlia bialata]